MKRWSVMATALLALAGAAVAQIAWPLRGAVGQTWTVNIQGLGTWVVPLTRTGSDGTPLGNTTAGPDQRLGYFQYEPTRDYTVLWLDLSQTDSYGCFAERADVQGNTVRGRALRDLNGQITNLQTPCTATLTASGAQTAAPTPPTPPSPSPSSAAALTWPPTLATGQQYSVTITGLAGWNVSLITQSATAYSGTAVPAGAAGTTLQASFFYRADVDTAELDLTDGTQLYACLFTGRASIQNGALRGAAYLRTTPQAAFTNLNTACEARLLASSTAVAPAPVGPAPVGPAPAGPAPTPPAPPSSQALSWPPAFAIGQTWSATFQAGTWGVTFTERDADGDPRGLTTSGPDRRTGGAFIDGNNAIFYVANNNEAIYCVTVRSGLNGQTLSGQAQRFAPPNAQQGQAAGPCSFTLQGATTAAQPSNPSSPTQPGSPMQPGASQPAASSPASALTWPPAFALGQRWNVTFQNGTWAVTFTERDSDGDPRGLTTSGPDRRTAGAFVDGNSAVFYVANANEAIYCVTQRSGLNGNTVSGQAQRFSPPNAQQSQAAGACSFTLQNQTLARASGLEGWLKPLVVDSSRFVKRVR